MKYFFIFLLIVSIPFLAWTVEASEHGEANPSLVGGVASHSKDSSQFVEKPGMSGFIQDLDKIDFDSSITTTDALFNGEELRSQAQYLSENGHLDNTKLGQAVLKGNKEDYLTALKELRKGNVPIADIFGKTTKEGKDLLHLLVAAPENKEFFNKELLDAVILATLIRGDRPQELNSLLKEAKTQKNDSAYQRLYNFWNMRIEGNSIGELIHDLHIEKKEYKAEKSLRNMAIVSTVASGIAVIFGGESLVSGLGILGFMGFGVGAVISCKDVFKLSKRIQHKQKILQKATKNTKYESLSHL